MTLVFLHIGLGKTGTTAIQTQLSRIRAQLHEYGIHYVYSDDEGSGSGHQNFAKSFISARPSYMIAPVHPSETRVNIRSELISCRFPIALLSSENFTLANIDEVKSYFEDVSSVQGVRIVLFVRSQDELAESRYNQMVKLKGLTASFNNYLETEMTETEFDAIAFAWADRFGADNVICRIFDARAPNLMSVFLSCVRADTEWPAELLQLDEKWANNSIGYFSLHLILALNRLGNATCPQMALKVSTLLSTIDIPALLFDAEDARAYCDRYAAANARFSSRFLDRTMTDLGGRRYSDGDRDIIRGLARQLPADRWLRALEQVADELNLLIWMKGVAIMQPYIFPHWPYVQLMGCVDLFIVLDTVQQFARGWINRNRICLNGKPHLISFPLGNAPRNTLIRDIRFAETLPLALSKIKRTLTHAYARRPYGEVALSAFDLAFCTVRNQVEPHLVPVALHSFEVLRRFVPFRCDFELASRLPPLPSKLPEDCLVALATYAGADIYVNPIGGRILYKNSAFKASNIHLQFLEGTAEGYAQGTEFIPGLSALDLLANISGGELGRRMRDFVLIDG